MTDSVRSYLRSLLPAAATLLAAGSLTAAEAVQPARGPFWSGTIMRSKSEAAAMKGLAVTLGNEGRSYVVYDLDTMRLAAAWTGEFLEFGNTLTKIEWPPPPTVKGTNIVFDSKLGPGWADKSGSLADPRAGTQGPLPKDWAHYSGLYVHDDRVVLSYTVGATPVLELPGFVNASGQPIFARTLQFPKGAQNLTVLLADGISGDVATDFVGDQAGPVTVSFKDGRSLTIGGSGLPKGSRLESTPEGKLVVKLAKLAKNDSVRLLFSSEANPGGFFAVSQKKPLDLRPYTEGGGVHWPEEITTVGKVGTEDGPYQVDTITEPFPNPYNVSTFFGGFDFLPDGRAAICTFHGDVWVVSGLDNKLEKLTWKRFATGLFQPLGLKVVKGDIYIAGRDQITRLKDVNKDGEADFYENFNNDTVVTPNYHEFVLDLHTDSKGNFYYAKGAPWEPSVSSPHQGTILKVSPDGKKMEVFASGLRAPNGMTVGPDDTVLVGDNQGHWMPSSKLNLVKPGAFMGMTPAAQKSLTLRYTNGTEIVGNPSDPEFRKANKLKGWDSSMPIPVSYDEPIAWVPMRWDNSSGGQVYVTSDKWGPWKGAPLFMSYGKCLLYGVMTEKVGDTTQAALVPFSLKFASGVMRGRFSTKDGQLYLAGLKGWQNAASRDGGFYRVRYTGKPVTMPVKTRTGKNGIQLTFATELDAKTAEDVQSYAVELWNYKYSGAYGSPEFSVKTPGKQGHDKLEVKSAKLSADKNTLLLEVDGLEVANQYSVKYSLTAANGAEVRSEVIGTIHKLGPELSATR
jgi:hypothetical protein